jgi:hypothetical protein
LDAGGRCDARLLLGPPEGGPWLRLPADHAKISLHAMAKVFPFSVLPTADLVIDAVYEGGTKGNTADDVLGRLIPGAGNQGGFRAVGSWDVPRLVICLRN